MTEPLDVERIRSEYTRIGLWMRVSCAKRAAKTVDRGPDRVPGMPHMSPMRGLGSVRSWLSSTSGIPPREAVGQD